MSNGAAQPKPKISKMNILNNAAGIGMIGFGTYTRLKDGESFIPAVAKEVMINSAFMLLPGGMLGGFALMGAMMAPSAIDMIDRAGHHMGKKFSQFGGGFMGSEQQEMAKTDDLNKMMAAKQYASQRQAMRNHKVY